MIANTCAKSNDLKIPGIKTIGIQLIDAGLQYHDSLIPTLSSINMVIPEGKWTVILGKSGCVKTTILRCVHLQSILNAMTIMPSLCMTKKSSQPYQKRKIAFRDFRALVNPTITNLR